MFGMQIRSVAWGNVNKDAWEMSTIGNEGKETHKREQLNNKAKAF